MNHPPKLADYVFTERLGRGSSAVVFKAYRIKDMVRQAVAVKCIEKKTLTKFNVENILTEISILKKIRHEFIVELKDFRWDDHYVYLIMEYCSGGELSQFIQSHRRLPELVVRHFLQQLAKALQVLHSNNIAHMDLKPQNILLSSRSKPVIKLADFGLAQHLHPYDTASSLRGSPLYMAPEIFIRKHYDARVDLWSVGIILYECLFGRAPYSSDSFSKLVEKIKAQKPIEIPYGADISLECRDLLLRLLQQDPDKRITFEDFFSHPFVDLERMPSSESYDKGVQLIQEAVSYDELQLFDKAFQRYSEGLCYLVPIAQWETDVKKKAALHQKVTEYLNRAQVLKEMMRGQPDAKVSICQQQHPLMSTARREVQEAERLVKFEKYLEALAKYQASLEVMVPYVRDLQNGNDKKALYEEVASWMKRAEDLKEMLKLQKQQRIVNMENLDQAAKAIGADSVSCCIQ